MTKQRAGEHHRGQIFYEGVVIYEVSYDINNTVDYSGNSDEDGEWFECRLTSSDSEGYKLNSEILSDEYQENITLDFHYIEYPNMSETSDADTDTGASNAATSSDCQVL